MVGYLHSKSMAKKGKTKQSFQLVTILIIILIIVGLWLGKNFGGWDAFLAKTEPQEAEINVLESEEMIVQEAELAQQESVAAGSLNNPSLLYFPAAGEIRIYYLIHNKVPRKVEILHRGSKKPFVLNPGNDDGLIGKDTGLQVKANERVFITVFEDNNYSKKAFGWIAPNPNRTCGVRPHAKVSIGWAINSILSVSKPIASIQCWSDWEQLSNPVLDFNDFALIFSYKP